MNDNILAITKLNLRNIKPAYLVSGICVALMVVQLLVPTVAYLGFHAGWAQNGTRVFDAGTGTWVTSVSSSTISLSWYTWLLVWLAAVWTAGQNYGCILRLGGKRLGFLRGAAVTYVLLAAAGALIVTVLYYALDRPLNNFAVLGGFMAPPDVFGWAVHGPVMVFVEQFAVLLLLAAVVHTLEAALARHWYGYAAVAVLIALIAVFSSITPLRHVEGRFFTALLFGGNPAVQIILCLVLAVVIYALSKPILDRTPV